jgi:hypothetical protein
MLTDFYTAFSPACFSLLALWLAIITLNAPAWLNLPEGDAAARSPESQRQQLTHRQRQAYIVALYFAAPGSMSLLALIDPQSTSWWRSFFIIVSVLGVAGMFLFGPFPNRQPHHLLDVSDHVVHWIAIGLYLAIATLALPPLHALRIEGVLLTVLVLLGVHVALRLMFATGASKK